MDPEAITRYLELLGEPRAPPSRPALDRLLAAHLDRVPYETLDITSRRPPPPLDTSSAVRRVLEDRRGGYCFELVGAFTALLRGLGYNVSLHHGVAGTEEDRDKVDWGWLGGIGRTGETSGEIEGSDGRNTEEASEGLAVGGPPPSDPTHPNHVVAIVTLDNTRYVADVGLGDGPPRSFELKEGDWQLFGRTYHLKSLNGGAVWRWTHTTSGSFPGMDFASAPIRACEVGDDPLFQRKHRWYHADPTASFYKAGVVVYRMRRVDGAVLRLRGRTVTVIKGEAEEPAVAVTARSQDELCAVIVQVFGSDFEKAMSHDEVGRVWDRSSPTWKAKL